MTGLRYSLFVGDESVASSPTATRADVDADLATSKGEMLATDEVVMLRVWTGSPGVGMWRIDVEIDEWNGLPRIKSVTTEDYLYEREEATS